MTIVKIILLTSIYICLLTLGFKAYIKANLGKERGENNEVNMYIYLTSIYLTFMTLIAILILLN